MPEHDTLNHSTEVASAINSATSKTPPVDADELGLIDSAASNVLKKLTWANLKAAIKSYLEGLASISFTGSVSAGSLDLTSPSLLKYMTMDIGPYRFSENAITGTGSTSIHSAAVYLATGASISSTAVRYSNTTYLGFSDGKGNSIFDFSKKLLFQLMFRSYDVSNGNFWITFGVVSGSVAAADPTGRSIGVRNDAGALKGIVHDGSTLTVVDLSKTLTTGRQNRISIYSDGAGNIYWYDAQGTLLGSTSAGPSDIMTGSECGVPLVAVTNTAAAQIALQLSGCKIIAEQ